MATFGFGLAHLFFRSLRELKPFILHRVPCTSFKCQEVWAHKDMTVIGYG